MNKEEFRRICRDYCKDKNFQLNPDEKFLNMVLDGVLKKEEETGLRYCPCRLPKNDLSKDWELLCPCFFQALPSWQEKGQCWCSLFYKVK